MSTMVFLLLSFPLGLCHFLITVIGLSLGIGTLVIWIGLPILFGTLFLIRIMAEVERRMISNLLHLPFPYRLRSRTSQACAFCGALAKCWQTPLPGRV